MRLKLSLLLPLLDESKKRFFSGGGRYLYVATEPRFSKILVRTRRKTIAKIGSE